MYLEVPDAAQQLFVPRRSPSNQACWVAVKNLTSLLSDIQVFLLNMAIVRMVFFLQQIWNQGVQFRNYMKDAINLFLV